MFNNTQINEKFEIKRGDVVKVNNPVAAGTKTACMAGEHYAVVCSNTKGNLYSNVVTVAYATGGVSRADLPCNCVIQFYDFLPEPVVGHLTKEDEIRFNRCLISSLALEDC